MNWYKKANKEISVEELNTKLKKLIKTHPFFRRLLSEYNVPEEAVDNELDFEIKDLDKKHAEADGHTIIFNENLFTDGDFFDNKIFYFVHEFFHWIKRRIEDEFYFNDPEETQSFTLSMAWEIARGVPKEQIEKDIYPIISGHFANPRQARQICEEMFQKATSLAQSF
tara:strand:+ start:4835 stop:5338 length:504 start_codon:yes stop_codon:yes gene_type:complete